jgi:hypothetical protein
MTEVHQDITVAEAYASMKGWDYSIVENYLARVEGVSPEKVAGMKEEYIRFLSLVVGEQTPAPISYAVDPFWHAHVLHTMNYLPFSRAVSRGFLHHNPVATEEERLALQGEYDGFIERYKKYYGTPNPDYWGGSDMVCKCCCSGGEEIFTS